MNRSVKDFIDGAQFPCGSKASGNDLAYPCLKDSLISTVTVATNFQQSCDYVTNGYGNFKGSVYHCGSDSLSDSTQNTDINELILVGVKGKNR